jgi:hypothetical protein
MIEIKQKPFWIIADSGATSLGMNLSVVKELNLLASIKPMEYTYRTSSGKVEKALGTIEVSLRIRPIVVKTDMVVMPSGCGYNMLLGNELMTTLRADIMRSLKVVRFQVGDCVTSIPMLRALGIRWRFTLKLIAANHGLTISRPSSRWRQKTIEGP